MKNAILLVETEILVSKVWEVRYKGEIYKYTAYYGPDNYLVRDHITDEYGYDVNNETLKEDIFDFWNSQQ